MSFSLSPYSSHCVSSQRHTIAYFLCFVSKVVHIIEIITRTVVLLFLIIQTIAHLSTSPSTYCWRGISNLKFVTEIVQNMKLFECQYNALSGNSTLDLAISPCDGHRSTKTILL